MHSAGPGPPRTPRTSSLLSASECQPVPAQEPVHPRSSSQYCFAACPEAPAEPALQPAWVPLNASPLSSDFVLFQALRILRGHIYRGTVLTPSLLLSLLQSQLQKNNPENHF